MIELIPDVADNVIAVRTVGEVTSDDYKDVIFPAFEEKTKDHDKIRFLYQFGPDYSGMTAGAMWKDEEAGRKYFHHFEKTAVVADEKWVRRSMKAFGWMIPGQVKLFGAEEFDDALAWITD